MVQIVEHLNIWVCDDCICYIANGEGPPDGEDRTPIFDETWKGWQTTTGWYEPDRDPEDALDALLDGSEVDEFSHEKCEGCDALAGRRHKACAFKVEESETA